MSKNTQDVEQSVDSFRRSYPQGASFVVAHDIERAYTRTHSGVRIDFVSLQDLIARLSREPIA